MVYKELIKVIQEILPFVLLLIVSCLIEFHIRYGRGKVSIENFYIRGIRILILIVIAIRLNYYGGIYTFISFILTYIICAILDNRYREKFESVWRLGTKDIEKYVKVNKKITLVKWIKIRCLAIKKSYGETFEIFRFKIVTSIIAIVILYFLYQELIKYVLTQ
ncbi:MAG: hypothetical protein ACRC3Y_05050 [Romboutsia sp.]|uniref:hypothetical protein n=1 Tax=Romboutsia sp. TaxID=1965302 RepID=UPI003F36603A